MSMAPTNENILDSSLNKPEKHQEVLIPEMEISKRSGAGREFTPPPWLFKHHDLNNALESAKSVDEAILKNKLNYIHFMNKNVLVQLRHPRYDDLLIVTAKPGPCTNNEVTCQLLVDSPSLPYLEHYTFLHLIIDDGQSLILIPVTLTKMKNEMVSLQLPQKGYSVGQRQIRRYSCDKIDVEMVQRGLMIKGELLDYSPKGFCVRVRHLPSNSFAWSPGSGALTMVQLRKDQQNLFSSLCQCLRQQDGLYYSDVVLAPAKNQVSFSESEQNRKPAKNILLTPVIIFDHPFFGERIRLDVSDISTSGFSVYEKRDEGVLIEGMIIPDLIIEFAGSVRLKCSAQVTGRNEEDEGTSRSDFAILDMEINSYSQLSHILVNALDSHAYISREVDMDALWEFFFESGFIYPKKYGILQQNREHFKATWSKLYQQDLEISKHVTYQKNGRIYGHISMLRAYERTWIIQHYAAKRIEGRSPGLTVLKQIVCYLNEMHRLPSTMIDYMMVYFRPENRVPEKIFGGFARSSYNIGICSMDLFCYMPYSAPAITNELPIGWSLSECSGINLCELNLFYRNRSGGLLIDALGIAQKNHSEKSFEEAYSRLGLLRKWRAYSLEYRGELAAVLIVNQSDFGFNLSEFLNGIQVLLINQKYVFWNILSTAIGQLLVEHHMEKASLLFFPSDDVKASDIPFEKHYQLWIYDARFVEQFVEYMKRKFRIKDW